MTIDIQRIADSLPACERRRFYQNAAGVHVQCGPAPTNGIDAKTIISDPKFFRVYDISLEACYTCKGLAIPIELPDLALTPVPKVPPHLRRFRVEDDGSIVYEKKTDEWEPPKDIEGFERDTDNLWRFVSNWPVCKFRVIISTATGNCGFVRLKMACKHRDLNVAPGRLTYAQCCSCLKREEGE